MSFFGTKVQICKKRLVLETNQILSFHLFDGGYIFADDFTARFGQIINVWSFLNFKVVGLGANRQGHIAKQSPGGGSPG